MKKILLLFSLVVFTFGKGYAQQLWRNVTSNEIASQEQLERDSNPTAYKLFSLDLDAMRTKLAAAPSRFSGQISNVIVTFPNVQGELEKFRIYEASVMHPELAARFPQIQSYVGKGIDDPTATIRFSVTLFGLHTMTFSGIHGTSYIDPFTKDRKNYMVYSRAALTTNNTFHCDVTDRPEDLVENTANVALLSSNGLFKTYRLAMACTIEYAAFHVNAAGLNAGTLDQKKAAVLAAMNVTMTRVNGIYEKDFALTMVFVPNNLDVIFITSDEFDNANTDNILLDQSQTVINAAIGLANYDIGHTVSTGGGGVAQLQSPCSNSKARGITGLDAPVGDPYDVDYVSHEMGHQYGCAHTFNGDQGSCNGNRTGTSAFEPGSGSTIMGYSGICAPQNIQNFSDAYFHARSLIQGSAFINAAGNCAVAVPNNNTAPVADAGTNYTIPFGTAFVLKGSATDADGDALTYCWEQYDNQISTQPPVATSTNGPNFRTFDPTASPNRYFPKFSDVLANNLTPTWEVVPNVARTMNFSLVVRDNGAPLGSQTDRKTMQLIYANVGPFKVTSQSGTEAWAQNSTQNVTWDVAGTTENGINTALVNIRMSTDGGLTFPYLLAENTPNDGNEVVTAPNAVSLTCRIMVEAVGNVFYALNSKAFAVGYTTVTNCETYDFNTPFTLGTSYTVKSIPVPLTGTISDVNIHVNATHPNLQNLNFAVIRPGANIYTYYNQQCPGSANMDVTFDAQGAPFACTSPLTGTLQTPVGSFDTFNGSAVNGNWQFGFRSNPAGGTVNSFSLEVCAVNLVILGAEQFEFNNFALYPNPNHGAFAIRFNSNSGNKIDIAVHDISGRKIYDRSFANNNGLFQQEITLNNAQSGVYLVTVVDGDKKITKRIAIE